jgi:hypothetical protein
MVFVMRISVLSAIKGRRDRLKLVKERREVPVRHVRPCLDALARPNNVTGQHLRACRPIG